MASTSDITRRPQNTVDGSPTRLAMDGLTLEVTRLATDGTENACSLLYGAARRVAFMLGYSRILTYTLVKEGGVSLRAAGFTEEATIQGESWMRRSQNGRMLCYSKK